MVDFAAESPPLNVDPELGEYISRLERRLAEAFQKIHDLEALYVEPNKRQIGMIRYADGTQWNPGYGRGLYFWEPTEGMWYPAFFTTGQEINDLSANVTWDTVPDAYVSESSVTQHEAAIDHDALTNFVAAEHIDWSSSGTQTLDNSRVTSANVTQHEADIDHDALTNFVVAEHIDWSVTGAEDVHEDRITQLSVTQHEAAIMHGNLASLGADDHTQYHNDTRGDARYYTKTLLDAGQLDTRYYTESEVDALTWDASDIVTGTFVDARIAQSNVTQHEAAITHQNLSGAGTNTHSQIDTHIAASTAHGITTLVDGGSFTPTVYDAQTGGNQATVTTASGTYHRINDLVFIAIRLVNIDTTGLTSGNDVYIRDLPVASGTEPAYLSTGISNVTLSTDYLVAELAGGSSFIRLAEMMSASPQDYVRVTELSGGGTSDIWISGCYSAA